MAKLRQVRLTLTRQEPAGTSSEKPICSCADTHQPTPKVPSPCCFVRGVSFVRIPSKLLGRVHRLDGCAQALNASGAVIPGDLPVFTQLVLEGHQLAHDGRILLHDVCQPGDPVLLHEYGGVNGLVGCEVCLGWQPALDGLCQFEDTGNRAAK